LSATSELRLPGSTGATLAGTLHEPDPAADVRGSVLLAHCFTCSMDVHTMTPLGGLSEAGYVVLRFDFTGLGSSGGEFSATTVSHNVRDLAAAASVLVARGYGPCGLLGHSLGGAASRLAARRLKTVRSVVVLGVLRAPTTSAVCSSRTRNGIVRDGQALVSIAGRPFAIADSFLEALARHDAAGDIASFDRPLLVVHAVEDEVVEIEQGERIFASARQPKAFHR
jgi:alpha-beta hydrolase superfamily lysophospholipase